MFQTLVSSCPHCFCLSSLLSLYLALLNFPKNICRRSKCWAIRSHRGSADNIRHYPLFASVIVYPTCCDTLKREPMRWVHYSAYQRKRHPRKMLKSVTLIHCQINRWLIRLQHWMELAKGSWQCIVIWTDHFYGVVSYLQWIFHGPFAPSESGSG